MTGLRRCYGGRSTWRRLGRKKGSPDDPFELWWGDGGDLHRASCEDGDDARCSAFAVRPARLESAQRAECITLLINCKLPIANYRRVNKGMTKYWTFTGALRCLVATSRRTTATSSQGMVYRAMNEATRAFGVVGCRYDTSTLLPLYSSPSACSECISEGRVSPVHNHYNYRGRCS